MSTNRTVYRVVPNAQEDENLQPLDKSNVFDEEFDSLGRWRGV